MSSLERREKMVKNLVTNMASNSSTMVEHLPHRPKVKDSSPIAAAGTEKEHDEKTSCQH
jgi:hypothetical protein